MSLLKRFIAACQANAEAEAIVDDRGTATFEQILRAAVGMSLVVEAKDRSPEGNVAIALPNSAAYPICFFGSMLAGRIAVPLNVLLQPAEIAFILQDAKINLVLTISLFKPLFEKIDEQMGGALDIICLDEMPQEPPASPPPLEQMVERAADDKIAAMLYTSGTTGKPKGVMLTHGNLETNYLGCTPVLQLKENSDTVIGVLPLFHSYGMMGAMICPLLDGAKTVMIGRFQPATLLSKIVEHRTTALLLVPPMYGILCRAAKAKGVDLSFVRLSVSGGGPLPEVVAGAWKQIAGQDIMNSYGLTETSPVVSVNRPWDFKFGTIGKPLDNVTVEIRDPDSGEALPHGQAGEICVKAGSVMRGYYHRPEESEGAFTRDGFFRSGDLGIVDDDGFLAITGRAKDLIIFAGENIMPMEIENALTSHPAVLEVSVVGLPDETKGEIPVAAIVLDEGKETSPDELREFLKSRLADFKIPRQFHFIEALPKNALNKVLKPRVVEMLSKA